MSHKATVNTVPFYEKRVAQRHLPQIRSIHEQRVAAFLARGGQVERLPAGASGVIQLRRLSQERSS